MNKNVTWTNATSLGVYVSFKNLEDLEMSHFESSDDMGYGDEDSDDDDLFEEDGVF